MSNATKTAGFYATDTDTFYVTPSDRVWLVGSEDELPTVREMDELPAEAADLSGIVTPEEAIGYCRQIEEASGETLLESA
jgi:hypothetical protein